MVINRLQDKTKKSDEMYGWHIVNYIKLHQQRLHSLHYPNDYILSDIKKNIEQNEMVV